MADPRTPAADSTAERSDYQPLSIAALASLVVSGLFMVIVLILGLTALTTRKPVVFPPLLFLAGLGLVGSIIARIQIDRSEGTRAGRKLTIVAWWLSVLGGAGYAAYLLAIVVAIRQQSSDISSQWFDALRKDDFYSAFLLTLDPGQRGNLNPRNVGEIEGRFGDSQLPSFRNSEMIRLIQRNGDQVNITAQGLRDWSHEPDGFIVDRSYLLTSPEGEMDMSVRLFGHEGRDLTRRIWSVKFAGDSSITRRRLSGYGQAINELQYDVSNLTREWLKSSSYKLKDRAYMLTLEASTRDAINQRMFMHDVLKIVTATHTSAMPIVIGATLILAPPEPEGLAGFANSTFFRAPEDSTLNDEQLALLRNVWMGMRFQPSGAANPSLQETIPRITVTDERILASQGIEMTFPLTSQYARGRLIMETRNPALLAKVKQLKEEAIAHPEKVGSDITSVLGRDPRDWRIIAIETEMRMETFKKPDGPPGSTQGLGH